MCVLLLAFVGIGGRHAAAFHNVLHRTQLTCRVQSWKIHVQSRSETYFGVSCSKVQYHKKIRRSNNVESAAVLKYHAIQRSAIDESDCCVIVGAGE